MASILLIDDDDILAEALAESLCRAGHTVALAGSGQEGLTRLEKARPHLVITDVLMPSMDGIELIRCLRRKAGDLPIIAMSGGGRIGTEMVLDMAAVLGATATIAKPCTSRELLALVERCLTTGPV